MLKPEAFEALTTSKGGIAKLRQLILDLAVRGLLVPQDPDDESANEVLKGFVKSKLETVDDCMPKSWLRVTIETIADVGTGSTPSRTNIEYYNPATIHWVTSGETSNQFIKSTKELVSEQALKETSLKKYPVGTLIMAMYGQGKTRGQISELCIEATTNQACAAIVLKINDDEFHRRFIKLQLQKKYHEIREKSAGGAQPNLNVGKVKSTLINFPPLAEQKRIVKKVDELMAFCDQLEKRQSHSHKVHQALLDTLLARLLEAEDKPTFQAVWTQIAANFALLFSTEADIDRLKQLVLDLAVRGKLGTNNSDDEPADVLLEKINLEKQKLIEDGAIKKLPVLPEITNEEKPFILPESWSWVRLGDVTNYGVTEKVEPSDATDGCWVLELEDIEKITSRLIEKVRYNQRQFQSSKNKFYKNDVLYGKLRPYLDKVIIADEDGVCTTEIIPIHGYKDLLPEFVRLVMKSPYFVNHANSSTHGMNLPRLGTDKARMALIPLLSFAEQKRIVKKVDELMACCDRIKEKIRHANNIQDHLATAIVEKAVA